MDSRFIARGWMGFNGSRRDRFVVRRRMGLVVDDMRLFCFLEGVVSTGLSSSIAVSRNGANVPRVGDLRAGERGGMTGSGTANVTGCSCLSKDETFHDGPSSSLGGSEGEMGLIQSSE